MFLLVVDWRICPPNSLLVKHPTSVQMASKVLNQLQQLSAQDDTMVQTCMSHVCHMHVTCMSPDLLVSTGWGS